MTSRPPRGGRGGGQRGRLAQPLGVGVGRPGGEVGRRAGALGVQQHLRAAVRDGLEGADRHAELLAVLDVLERHLERPLADADDLGGDAGVDARGRARRERLAVAASRGRSGAWGRS